MRIAMCTDQYLPQLGGVADSVHGLALELRAQGHDVRVFAPMLQGSQPDPNVVRLKAFSLKGMFNFVAPFGMLRSLRAYRPDVIHAHAVGIATLNAIRCARKLKVPVIATYHGAPADYLQYFYLDFWPIPQLTHKFTSQFFNACDVVTAPARTPLEVLRNHGTTRPQMKVVSNSIPFNLFRSMPEKRALKRKHSVPERAVMLFGRLAAEKNLGTAAAVFAGIAHKTDASLIVIGDGPSRATFEEELRRLKVLDRVLFFGRLSGEKLVEVINACDVMLTTSLTEAQPMAVLQAAACSVPIVGARAGGVPDCIDDGKTGFVVDPGDIERFVMCCVELLSDSGRARSMGEAAKSFVSRYAPENIAAQFVGIYSELCSTRADTSAE